MEKYLDILQNTLDKEIVDISPDYLDYYFEIIKKNGRLEILNNNDAWNKAFNAIENHYKIKKYQIIHSPDMVAVLANVVSAVMATQHPKKKINLFLLIAYLDEANIFYQHLIDSGFFENTKNNIINILNSLGFKINTHDLSNLHWESESFDNYEKGLENKNIKQIYDFISSYERGNGFIPDSYINFLIFVSCKILNNELIKVLDKQKSVLILIPLFYNLSIIEKLKIAISSTNILLKFEVLRGIFYFNKDVVLDENEAVLVKEIIIIFSKDSDFWQQFLVFYLEFPSRSPQLFKPLGLALNQLNNKQINLFINSIKIDKYINNKCRSALNNCFFAINDKAIQQFISKKIFEMWCEYIEGCDEYTNTILITNVIDIVIHYASNFLNDSQIIEAINTNIKGIKEIDNKWFATKTEQTNCFYKYMSKLFIYCISANAKSIKQVKLIQNICDNNLILRNEHQTNNKTTKTMFDEFVFNIDKVIK